jgi:hypothetical protein
MVKSADHFTMEPGSCSRSSWADEIEEEESARGAGRSLLSSSYLLWRRPRTPPSCSRRAPWTRMWGHSSLPRAGMRRGYTSPTRRLRSATLMCLLCRSAVWRPCSRASNAIANTAVLVGGLSCRTRVGPPLGHRHRRRVVWRSWLSTRHTCLWSRTPTASGWCRVAGVGGALQCRGALCQPTLLANASTALQVTMSRPSACSRLGASTAWARGIRSAAVLF